MNEIPCGEYLPWLPPGYVTQFHSDASEAASDQARTLPDRLNAAALAATSLPFMLLEESARGLINAPRERYEFGLEQESAEARLHQVMEEGGLSKLAAIKQLQEEGIDYWGMMLKGPGIAAIPFGPPGVFRAGAWKSVVPRGAAGAESAFQGAQLRTHLRLQAEYGQAGVRELANGRFRYYGELTPPRTPGTMVGRRLVREWDPATGAQRTWFETLDASGNVRIVRPETGGPKVHHVFDAEGNYIEQF
ncbi:MAG: hypothetical protein SX243_22465 [Acidobacteriota bacterium]|nr:hypothetical protein [Acidobacteriota bacterium]